MGTIYHMGEPYLGIPDLKAEVAYISLMSSSWSNNIYTITDARIGEDTVQYLSPAPGITDTQLEALQTANIQDGGQDEGHLYLRAYGDAPNVDVPIVITFTPGIKTVVNDTVDQTVIANSLNPVSGGAVHNFNSYSTTEQVVGTWIDGKPIYRKAGRLDSGTTGTGIIILDATLTSSIVDNVIESFCSGPQADDSQRSILPGGRYNSANYRLSMGIRPDGLRIHDSHVPVQYLIWWVEYTKVSD